MKFPTTLILKFNHNKNTQPQIYWFIRHLVQQKISASFSSKFIWFHHHNPIIKLFKKPYKFTIIYSDTKYLKKLSDIQKKFYLKTQAPNSKLKHKLLHSEHLESKIYDYFTYSDIKMSHKKFLREMLSLKTKIKLSNYIDNKVTTNFNLIFFKKEKIYTKLKYSRVPQYDAVSGGAAALLAGFLGYLITEKFGLELTDSGDFWFIFVYLSFAIFSFNPLLKIIMDDKQDLSVFSLRWGWEFYLTIFSIFFSFFFYLIKNRRK